VEFNELVHCAASAGQISRFLVPQLAVMLLLVRHLSRYKENPIWAGEAAAASEQEEEAADEGNNGEKRAR
jgi:hypothetical protein